MSNLYHAWHTGVYIYILLYIYGAMSGFNNNTTYTYSLRGLKRC
ncbi:MAG: hypothetical protein ACKPKO_00625 [Candidatus Fonsibacter sp.]